LRVLLIQPPDPESYPNPLQWTCEPLGLEYLASAVLCDGHEPRIIDLRLEPSALEREFAAFKPHVAGVTGFTMHTRAAQKVMRRVKEISPDTITVIGGHHATVAPADFFQPYVDYVVSGEGVRQFSAILRHHEKSPAQTADDIGDAWFNRGGAFRLSDAKLDRDINSLPIPHRRLNKNVRARYKMGPFSSLALMMTSQGCAFRCNFCSLWKLMDGRHISREAEKVVEELSGIEEEYVFLADDEPFTDVRRMGALADAIIASGIKKKIMCYCRADTMTRRTSLVEKWREAGLASVSMGVEAVTERELIRYNKKIEPAQIDEAFAIAASLGITIFPLFIVGTDYQPKDFSRLARFITRRRIKNPIFSVLTPLPGSETLNSFDHIAEMGDEGRPNWDLFDLQHPVTQTAMPKDEFMKSYYSLWLETGAFSNVDNRIWKSGTGAMIG